MTINAVTSGEGWVRVGVEDIDGGEVKGRGVGEANLFRGDGMAQAVTWGQQEKVGAGLIRLRIRMREATVYSVSFT